MAAFWWSIDIDKNPDTRIKFPFLGDLGYDYGIRVKYFPDTQTWTAILQDYTGTEPTETNLDEFYIKGATVTVLLPHNMINGDTDFYWTSNTNDYHYGPGTTGYIDKGMPEYAEY